MELMVTCYQRHFVENLLKVSKLDLVVSLSDIVAARPLDQYYQLPPSPLELHRRKRHFRPHFVIFLQLKRSNNTERYI